MKITIFYLTGAEATIEHVVAIRILADRTIEVQTFGNGPGPYTGM